MLALGAAPVRATVLYEASGGWNLAGGGNTGLLKQDQTPQMVTSGGGFSRFGALCPALGTPDYLCGQFFGAADINSNLLSLHAMARLIRHDGVGFGNEEIVYGGARVTIVGLTGSVMPPVGYAVFNFGLSGTASSSATPGIAVQAVGTAYLSSDRQRAFALRGTGPQQSIAVAIVFPRHAPPTAVCAEFPGAQGAVKTDDPARGVFVPSKANPPPTCRAL